MPIYQYLCPANDVRVTVEHSIDVTLKTWGEVCEAAGYMVDDELADAPVERILFPPSIISVQTNADLRAQGFKKLVRRDKGVYEDVTATDKSERIVLDPERGKRDT